MSANAAAILELSEQNPLAFDATAGVSISKGDLLMISNDLLVHASVKGDQPYAGVAAADKAIGVSRIAVHVPNQSISQAGQ